MFWHILHSDGIYISLPMINSTLGYLLHRYGISDVSRSVPLLYTNLLITTITTTKIQGTVRNYIYMELSSLII